MLHKISAQFVCPSPKFSNFWKKALSGCPLSVEIVKFAFVVKRISWIYRFPKNPCISLQCWMLMQGCRSKEGQKVIANNGVIKFLQNYFFYYMIFLYCGDRIRCNSLYSLVLVCLIHLLLGWVQTICVYYENITK